MRQLRARATDRSSNRTGRAGHVLQPDRYEKPSRTVLTMWTTRNATASSVRLRWRPETRNRGKRSVCRRAVVDHAEHDTRREQDHRDRPRCRASDTTTSWRSRPTPTSVLTGAPLATRLRRRRSGHPHEPARSCPLRQSQSGAASPRTTDTVQATFASTHDRAATVTVPGCRQAGPCADRRCGAARCGGAPAPNTRVELATPPDEIETAGPDRSRGASWSSAILIDHPPAGAWPATPTSPPSDTSTPDPIPRPPPPRSGRRRALRGRRRDRARSRLARRVRRSASTCTLCQPRGDGEPCAERARIAPAHARERLVVARKPKSPSDRRIDQSLRSRLPRSRADLDRFEEPVGDGDRPSCPAIHTVSSESGRKRLQAASTSASSCTRTARAAGSKSGDVTHTVAVVPSARSEAIVTLTSLPRPRRAASAPEPAARWAVAAAVASRERPAVRRPTRSAEASEAAGSARGAAPPPPWFAWRPSGAVARGLPCRPRSSPRRIRRRHRPGQRSRPLPRPS